MALQLAVSHISYDICQCPCIAFFNGFKQCFPVESDDNDTRATTNDNNDGQVDELNDAKSNYKTSNDAAHDKQLSVHARVDEQHRISAELELPTHDGALEDGTGYGTRYDE